MSCHGIQILGPVKFNFDKLGRFKILANFDSKSTPSELGLDAYCDSDTQEL